MKYEIVASTLVVVATIVGSQIFASDTMEPEVLTKDITLTLESDVKANDVRLPDSAVSVIPEMENNMELDSVANQEQAQPVLSVLKVNGI